MDYVRPDVNDQYCDEWVVRPPFDGDVQSATIHHVMGILRLRYPGARGTKQAVMPSALNRYGGRLFEQMHNIVKDCARTKKTLTFIVRWRDDGSPFLYCVSGEIENGEKGVLPKHAEEAKAEAAEEIRKLQRKGLLPLDHRPQMN